MDQIEVAGARLHNLKNVNAVIPKKKFVVVTGVSGSGKSSFLLDTLHQESQHLYLRAAGLSHNFSQADSFDLIRGLSPTIAVEQRIVGNLNPRSVVGTSTRLLNLLALVYANEGESLDAAHHDRSEFTPGMFLFNSPHGQCPECQGRGSVMQVDWQAIFPDRNASLEELHRFAYFYPKKKFEDKAYIEKRLVNFGERFGVTASTRFSDLSSEAQDVFLTYRPPRSRSKSQPQLIFYGIHTVMEERLKRGEVKVPNLQTAKLCPACEGHRIQERAMRVRWHGAHIGDLGRMEASELQAFIRNVQNHRDKRDVTSRILHEILKTLDALQLVGLSYLTLYRELPTLSGGELQRLHIMLQLTAKFDSVIYIFDEPTAGLHETEKSQMISSFRQLRDDGNTVIVIEHDEQVIRSADTILDFGPGAGRLGGTLLYSGSLDGFLAHETSLSAASLRSNSWPPKSYSYDSKETKSRFTISDARTHNLQGITVDVPLHCMIGVCGVSGSGKSSLILDSLLPKLDEQLARRGAGPAPKSDLLPESDGEESDQVLVRSVAELSDAPDLDGYIVVTQKLPRRFETSCVATFLGVWDAIRKVFAAQESAIRLGLDAGAFSFNSTGACSQCGGSGHTKRWMGNLLFRDLCTLCDGARFHAEVLQVRHREKSIADILNLSVEDAQCHFEEHPKIRKMLGTLVEIGMGYISMGQSLTTLSGGETQRLKLARELVKGNPGHYLYVLDEPTVGLSRYDTEKLLILLNRLVSSGHSVLVIEHDPYVLSFCDHLIELGHGGGSQGGRLVATGTPSELKANVASVTGRYLMSSPST
ncbi:excinuclease ABC subunit A [Tumebacillus flagellatus]|uniref:UvrABC system protein A n=1 Tax=Tumebacillus flagellatus TaxID=1157490 RepID=A0A074LQQ7_9BACL|nr:excinuclease ABC subunit A [Tumebacillus flagellatus]KEO82133.1 excinuclease ABC subunit A [Tumebacillus flagellatus]